MYKAQNKKAMVITLLSLLLLHGSIVKSQTPPDFSGKWQFNKAKSSPEQVESDYPGTIIRQITQTPTTISINDTYKQTGSKDWTTADEKYNLDGKEQTSKSDRGTNKKSTKWSQDKKTLSITNIDTQSTKGKEQAFMVTHSYKLSNDGKTLTIECYSKNPVTGETTKQKIYERK
jgi:hypothetical protein